MSVSNFDASRPDEFILVSDFESMGEASNATCSSKILDSITTAAIYETEPVRDAVDKTTPTVDGATVEEGIFE